EAGHRGGAGLAGRAGLYRYRRACGRQDERAAVRGSKLVPRFYLRQLRADPAAHDGNGAAPAHFVGIALATAPSTTLQAADLAEEIAREAILTRDVTAALEAAEHIVAGASDVAGERRRRRRRRGGRGRRADSAV